MWIKFHLISTNLKTELFEILEEIYQHAYKYHSPTVCVFQIVSLNRNPSAATCSSSSRIFDSASDYSNHDFSQISDLSDEDFNETMTKLSSLVIDENSVGVKSELDNVASGKSGLTEVINVEDERPEREIPRAFNANVDDSGDFQAEGSDILETSQTNDPNAEKLKAKGGQQKDCDESNKDASQEYTAKSETDFETTNARICGNVEDDSKKTGIRVLQPPGGYSSGIW